jgi:sugar-specific transcriptional regulator TrmB
MVESALKKIGLTDGEIKAYLALLEVGPSSIGKIIKKSKVSGSKAYEVLDRLMGKGLVSSITKNNVKHFEAASPEKILDYLEEKKQDIDVEKVEVQKIIPDLILKQKSTKKSEVRVFTGWEGMKTAEEDILGSLEKGDEWVSMGLTWQPKEWEIYFNKKQIERAEKGIIHKHLLNKKYKSLYETRKHLPHTEFRFLSEQMEMPTSTEVYKNKVAIFIVIKENPMVIIIENENVANSFRKYFYVMWKMAKP